jgi:hypothetical protein
LISSLPAGLPFLRQFDHKEEECEAARSSPIASLDLRPAMFAELGPVGQRNGLAGA